MTIAVKAISRRIVAGPATLTTTAIRSTTCRVLPTLLSTAPMEPFSRTNWSKDFKLAFGLSAGRVQSVALRLIVDREREIEAFVPEEYWNIGAALKSLGFSINSVDPAELDAAAEVLYAFAPHVGNVSNDYKDIVRSKDMLIHMGWNGDAAVLKFEPDNADTAYVVPSEGTEFWVDAWVIPAGAAHPNAAYAWLDYIMRPEIAAQETAFTLYGCAFSADYDLLAPEIRSDPTVFPPDELVAKLEEAQCHRVGDRNVLPTDLGPLRQGVGRLRSTAPAFQGLGFVSVQYHGRNWSTSAHGRPPFYMENVSGANIVPLTSGTGH